MNCGAINSGPSYVFRTSQKELKTAWKIDARCKTVPRKASILSLEKAFFDGMHSRCKGYKTLTLWTHHWTHHQGTQRMTRSAMMECTKENTKMVEIFFKLFNEALSKFVVENDYKINLTMLCMDKAGSKSTEHMKCLQPPFYGTNCVLSNIHVNYPATLMPLC